MDRGDPRVEGSIPWWWGGMATLVLSLGMAMPYDGKLLELLFNKIWYSHLSKDLGSLITHLVNTGCFNKTLPSKNANLQ